MDVSYLEVSKGGQSVTVVKCHGVESYSSKLSQWSECSVDVSCGSECNVVGSWMDVMLRHLLYLHGTSSLSIASFLRAFLGYAFHYKG